MEFTLLLSTTILAFSGFCIAFYGALSQVMIETETKIGMQKGFDQFTDDGADYFARKYKKWKAGSFFMTKGALILGLLTVIASIILNSLNNSWWSSIIVAIIGYFLYLIISKIIGSRIQLISIIIMIFSTCLSIYFAV